MNKGQLISAIAKKFFLTQTETEEIIEYALGKVTSDLSKGKRFYLRGFGSFIKEKRASKKVRHPKTRKIIIIPERTTVNFNPSESLIQNIK